jgi:site-specific DNA-methyltransferase (adenine-specific)
MEYLNKINLIDCKVGLKNLPDNCIDLTCCSPPYKNVDNYSEELIYDVASSLYRVHKPETLAFINFGHLAEDKFRPFRVCQIFLEVGWKLGETFTWVKNHYKPIQGSRRVNNLTEFIFMFYKENMPILDRLAIGVPYADKSNVGRYSNKDLKCGGNVWYIPYDTITKSEQKGHNDRYPVLLPTKCIKLAKLDSQAIVLDPFSGSGSTAYAAKKLGYQYIGFEISEDHYKYSTERLCQISE